jgi:hypothetical protein
VSWNRQRAGHAITSASALDWSITAMRETTDRLLQAEDWDVPHAFAVITEAVWWVTMVDATLVRYRPDAYGSVLASLGSDCRATMEGTFSGLRFVRNRMGYVADHCDFIRPQVTDAGLAKGRIAEWTWRPVRKPGLASLPTRGQEWELARFRDYRSALAGHTIEDTFGRAVPFLMSAAGTTVSRA